MHQFLEGEFASAIIPTLVRSNWGNLQVVVPHKRLYPIRPPQKVPPPSPGKEKRVQFAHQIVWPLRTIEEREKFKKQRDPGEREDSRQRKIEGKRKRWKGILKIFTEQTVG
jgi:hypothetical protein